MAYEVMDCKVDNLNMSKTNKTRQQTRELLPLWSQLVVALLFLSGCDSCKQQQGKQIHNNIASDVPTMQQIELRRAQRIAYGCGNNIAILTCCSLCVAMSACVCLSVCYPWAQ